VSLSFDLTRFFRSRADRLSLSSLPTRLCSQVSLRSDHSFVPQRSLRYYYLPLQLLQELWRVFLLRLSRLSLSHSSLFILFDSDSLSSFSPFLQQSSGGTLEMDSRDALRTVDLLLDLLPRERTASPRLATEDGTLPTSVSLEFLSFFQNYLSSNLEEILTVLSLFFPGCVPTHPQLPPVPTCSGGSWHPGSQCCHPGPVPSGTTHHPRRSHKQIVVSRHFLLSSSRPRLTRFLSL